MPVADVSASTAHFPATKPDEALARARCELGTVQHYVDAWDQCAAYLEVLVLLKRGEYPPAALLNAFISDD